MHNWESLYRPEKPIICTIEPHQRSPCLLIRSTHGPSDDYKEFTSVLDTSVETKTWPNSPHEHAQFSQLAKRPVPFTIDEPISKDEIIREPNFSDCGKFIASPYGVGVRLLAFDEHFSSFDTAYRFDEQQHFHDVVFKYARLDEKVITSFFSSSICQLACGTSTGTIQLYSPVTETTETIDSFSAKRRKRKYQRDN